MENPSPQFDTVAHLNRLVNLLDGMLWTEEEITYHLIGPGNLDAALTKLCFKNHKTAISLQRFEFIPSDCTNPYRNGLHIEGAVILGIIPEEDVTEYTICTRTNRGEEILHQGYNLKKHQFRPAFGDLYYWPYVASCYSKLTYRHNNGSLPITVYAVCLYIISPYMDQIMSCFQFQMSPTRRIWLNRGLYYTTEPSDPWDGRPVIIQDKYNRAAQSIQQSFCGFVC